MPKFPPDLLGDNESIVFDLKPHWVALIPPTLYTIGFLIFWAVAYDLAKDNFYSEGTKDLAQNVIAIISLVGIAWLAVPRVLRWAFTNFVLTTDRLIVRGGVFAKHSKEIPLERVNDVTFNQSIIERILKAGDLLIESAGERGQTKISNVRNPEQVQLMIFKESEENQNRMMRGGIPAARAAEASTSAGNLGGSSIPEQLEALARLKDQGVISELEFENKKAELLRRM
jgi:uncharacterized membrane protein YdbT with pleckstrin-like domain